MNDIADKFHSLQPEELFLATLEDEGMSYFFDEEIVSIIEKYWAEHHTTKQFTKLCCSDCPRVRDL